jgi:hypothetical protein
MKLHRVKEGVGVIMLLLMMLHINDNSLLCRGVQPMITFIGQKDA